MIELGLEGYGFWWLLLEIIGKEMGSSDKCELSYPLAAWARKLQCSKRKTSAFFLKFSEISLIFLEYDKESSTGKLKVSVPNLLKYKDEYSKKSGQTPDKLPEVSGAKIEIEKHKKTIGEKSPAPSVLFDMWNEIVKEPRATVMNKTREAKCRVRLKERTPEEWRQIFTTILNTPFLTGKNDRGWRADFDWITGNDVNAAKVAEGKYKSVNSALPCNGASDEEELARLKRAGVID